ncbi:hypothetical protein BZG36_02987 [Bifiguratus adelaidae]|uniref:E2 ubiquitin-conjugating enzyme n=1 Tax=Bifiguratus adelaidae TaxID=1938954 RepID=A0A261XYF7_9FUNG|nr:hypothetical protein BZG36_02987 [Bifiguratus adelaidae]
MATKRLQKEFAELQGNPQPGVSVGLVDEDLFHWQSVLAGPETSPYKGGKFHLDIKFPTDYPFKPPVVCVKFHTKIYHPNIDDDGSICVSLLKNDVWKPATRVSQVLMSISVLLNEPNPDDALVGSIAEMYTQNHAKFVKTAKDYTKKYAM